MKHTQLIKGTQQFMELTAPSACAGGGETRFGGGRLAQELSPHPLRA
ncbi:MAG: hypothetical protein IPK53_09025 [bacterium]|nr:hypothetical protein [bacterium]